MAAIQNYAALLGYDDAPPIAWHALLPLKEDESVVVPIVATVGSHQDVKLYFKSFLRRKRSEEELRTWQEAFRLGIERDRWVSERLEQLGASEDFEIRRVLASDPDRLSLVTLGVEGDPLGKAWRWLLRGNGTADAMDRFNRVGRLIRLLEQASIGEPDSETFVTQFKVDLARHRLEMFLGNSSLSRLEDRFENAANFWSSGQGFEPYYAHGDIDRANVLLDGDQVGLIDCLWEPRPVTFDLTRFLLRLRLEKPQERSWSADVAASAMEGYGDPGVTFKPEFTLLTSMKLLGLMQRFRAAGRWVAFHRARRALVELLES
jgi:hypothetical protein